MSDEAFSREYIIGGAEAVGIEIRSEYLWWLYELINPISGDTKYTCLINTLHKIEFFSIVERDDNRGGDGQKLREEFLSGDGSVYPENRHACIDGPCSVLEMLIALARRFESQAQESEETEANIVRWFWLFIQNLGLTPATDDVWFEELWKDKVTDAIGRLLTREYKKNGVGGLFPLRDSQYDQRNREIYYQMCDYIMENYHVGEQ